MSRAARVGCAGKSADGFDIAEHGQAQGIGTVGQVLTISIGVDGVIQNVRANLAPTEINCIQKFTSIQYADVTGEQPIEPFAIKPNCYGLFRDDPKLAIKALAQFFAKAISSLCVGCKHAALCG